MTERLIANDKELMTNAFLEAAAACEQNDYMKALGIVNVIRARLEQALFVEGKIGIELDELLDTKPFPVDFQGILERPVYEKGVLSGEPLFHPDWVKYPNKPDL
jgi:hypothetical protein